MISDSMYMEFLENCASFNKRISTERRHRMPFLDPQTGVAQNSSNLYRSKRERRPGVDASVVYTYPAKRWKKKKSSINLLIADIRSTRCEEPSEPGTFGMVPVATVNDPSSSLDTSIFAAVASNTLNPKNSSADLKSQMSEKSDVSGLDKEASNSRAADQSGGWYDDLSDQGVDDFDDQSEDDYEEERRNKKRKKAAPAKQPKRAKQQQNVDSDIEKPHVCMYCGAKYKTKPGLHYHLTHAHTEMMDQTSGQMMPQQQQPSSSDPTFASPRSAAPSAAYHSPRQNQQQVAPPAEVVAEPPAPSSQQQPHRSRTLNVSNYCDFCLGDAAENKKTNSPEELISCKDCGRAGHPSCLQFTANMIISTKRHGWQCIECKSCAVCGTSENDDKLLFCDDCDRGFHMYCLKPPLSAPPDGNWSCHLCLIEFGPNASNPGPSRDM